MAFMKLRLYAMAFLAFSFALSSCQKDDDPAPLPEVVGKWTLDYGVLSGFSNATINGAKVNPYSELYWGDYFLTSQIHILNNDRKSFVEVIKVEGFAEDLIGTWITKKEIYQTPRTRIRRPTIWMSLSQPLKISVLTVQMWVKSSMCIVNR
jgi:hypothetical protein